MIDVETVAQYLQLLHGDQQPELFEPVPVATTLARLADLAHLSEKDARVLHEGREFLQRLSTRLRIVDNRSISDLDQECGDLEGLALTLGYEPSQRSGGARRALLDEYGRHTTAIREVYTRVLKSR